VHLREREVDVGGPGPGLQEPARGGCRGRGDDGELLALVPLLLLLVPELAAGDELEAPGVDLGGRRGDREGAVFSCSSCCCCFWCFSSSAVVVTAGVGAVVVFGLRLRF